ncbi:MAG: IS66 family insertion sequence element accessory protein TnpB [Kiritimatiellia bacterium]|nr:IS66 family insertion sequence element accessory protein TnpB [Kiritimatiellia bacterium]
MFALTAAVRLFLYRGAVDMRKGADGLSGIVRYGMAADPLSGDVFVFCNRRRTMVKLLYWDRDGYAVWMKRLERGRYRVPDGPVQGEVDRATLSMMLEGVIAARRLKRYEHRKII